MGHREQLLAGAKQCLYERGYSRTTARDIVAASGTNLASIGYHFGSKEALLNAAIVEAIGELMDEVKGLVPDDPGAGPVERLESLWTRITEAFASHRDLLVAAAEGLPQAAHVPELRERFAEGGEAVRQELAAAIHHAGAEVDETSARALGSFHLALIGGLVLQWLVDPRRAPTGHEMTDALRIIAELAHRD